MRTENNNEVKRNMTDTDEVKKQDAADNIIPYEILQQKQNSYRIIDVNRQGKSLKLRLRQPTSEEIDWADWEYSKVFNDAISEGIKPRSALIDTLMDNGIDIMDLQKNADSINDELQETRQKFLLAKSNNDLDTMKRLREDIVDLRERWQRKNAIIRDYLRQSAESKAEDAREHFLLATILEYADGVNKGKTYYTSHQKDGRRAAKERYAKFTDDDDQAFKLKIILEFITFINGLSIDDLNKFPEDDLTIKKDDNVDDQKVSDIDNNTNQNIQQESVKQEQSVIPSEEKDNQKEIKETNNMEMVVPDKKTVELQ